MNFEVKYMFDSTQYVFVSFNILQTFEFFKKVH